MSDRINVLLLDSNKESINKIKEILPDYVNLELAAAFDSAKRIIEDSSKAALTEMVMINGQKLAEQGIKLLDFMRNSSYSSWIESIPVILFVEDEFSDISLRYLEIGDVFFYEGEIEEGRLYSLFIEVLDEAESLRDLPKEEHIYSEEKPATKIAGLNIRIKGESENSLKRAFSFSDENRKAMLAQALARGKRKQEQIKEAFEAALFEKKIASRLAETKNDSKKEVSGIIFDENSSVNNRYGTIGGNNTGFTNNSFGQTGTVNGNIAGAMRPNYANNQVNPDVVNQKTLNPQAAEKRKHTIVIIDADASTLELCDKFLKDRYNAVCIESGMNAISYFTKNTADLILIAFEMPNLNGVKIMESIRWQQMGMNVPVIFMTSSDPAVIRPQITVNGAINIIKKPLTPGGLMMTVDSLFYKR